MEKEMGDMEDSSKERKENVEDKDPVEMEDVGGEETEGEEEMDMTKLYDEAEEEEALEQDVDTLVQEEEEDEGRGDEQLVTEEEEKLLTDIWEAAPIEEGVEEIPIKIVEVEEEEEQEGEVKGEEDDEFTVLPVSGAQGDFPYESEEEDEDEEYPKESPIKDDILTQAAKRPSGDAVETIVSEPQRPKVFVCGEGEKDRNPQLESYCCQQIKIPPLLPHILKTYTKGAIKTQPRDLLRWSAAYFRALANDEPPPVKERLEYPTMESPCGLTKGLLRVLHKQLGKTEQVRESDLRERWMGLCLDGSELTKLLHLNSLVSIFDWNKFVVVASASIVNEHIVETMTVFCETMTLQPDGVDPYIPYQLFVDAYTFLGEKLGVDMNQAELVCNFLRNLSSANYDLVGPKDYLVQECPSLF